MARRGFGDKSWTHNGEWRVSEEDVSPLDDENSLYVELFDQHSHAKEKGSLNVNFRDQNSHF